MEFRGLMPAALVPLFAMSAAALALCDLSCKEIPDYSLNFTPDSKEYLDIILAEQVHCPGAHASCENMRDVLPGKEYRQFPRLVPGALENFP